MRLVSVSRRRAMVERENAATTASWRIAIAVQADRRGREAMLLPARTGKIPIIPAAGLPVIDRCVERHAVLGIPSGNAACPVFPRN